MDKQDIENLIAMLKVALTIPEDQLRTTSCQDIVGLRHKYGPFDMLCGDYAITNVRKRAFFQAMTKEVDSPAKLN